VTQNHSVCWTSVRSVWYIFRLFFSLVDLKCWVTSLILDLIPRLLNFVYEFSYCLCCFYVNCCLLNQKQENILKCEHASLCICLRETFPLRQYCFFFISSHSLRLWVFSGNLPESDMMFPSSQLSRILLVFTT